MEFSLEFFFQFCETAEVSFIYFSYEKQGENETKKFLVNSEKLVDELYYSRKTLFILNAYRCSFW